jgi:predicted RNase H-like nuclease (RuvC/YqgF family)
MTTRPYELVLNEKPKDWPPTAGTLIIRKAEHLPRAYQANYGDEVKYLELLLHRKILNADKVIKALQDGLPTPIKLVLGPPENPGGDGEKKIRELRVLVQQEESRVDEAEREVLVLSRKLAEAESRLSLAEAEHQALEKLREENRGLQATKKKLIEEQARMHQISERLNTQLQYEQDNVQRLEKELAARRRAGAADHK